MENKPLYLQKSDLDTAPALGGTLGEEKWMQTVKFPSAEDNSEISGGLCLVWLCWRLCGQ